MTKPLRILQIVHSLDVGGLERVVVDLSKGLMNRGHYVEVCCLTRKGALGEQAERSGMRVTLVGKRPGIVWRLPFRLAKEIKNGKFDIVHTHNEAGMLYGISAVIIARSCKIIHTEHGKEPGYERKKALRVVEKLLLKKARHVVKVAQAVAVGGARSLDHTGRKLTVIANGIDVDYFYRPEARERARKDLGISKDDFLIGTIGRLVALKNHMFLLTIFEKLLNEDGGVRLIIVGDGPLRGELERKSAELGVSQSVIFLGERSDIPELLAAIDLFVLPSVTEGFSITVLEAIASGKPIVASDVGGNPEIIQDGKSGFLVPIGEVGSWIIRIRAVIGNPELRKQVSDVGRRIVKERFSLDSMIDSYEKLYYE